MKKVLVSVFALATLAGCASYYDYYKGDIRYTQDGEDCIYYVGEYGNRFNREIRNLNTGKKIVYRNTRCEDLYNRDMMGQAPRADRAIITPAPQCTRCNSCNMSQKYILVSAM